MARELFSRRGPHLADSRLPSDGTHRPATDRRHRAHAAARKGSTCRPLRVVIIGGLCLAVVVFFALAFWQQSTIIDGFGDDASRRRPLGSVLRFVPADLQRRFEEQGGLDRLRSEREPGIRRPRVALSWKFLFTTVVVDLEDTLQTVVTYYHLHLVLLYALITAEPNWILLTYNPNNYSAVSFQFESS
ncbi:hypothetical protein COCNU_07G011220 [Cocos nucifera]|uniref:Uncharacterized protein n=1 Tax=Cocos nucifera TaxID=13894 RepID=A0A8K0N4R9_COCNU|nr:hypothetical protein COCNU_07G011220 [Cocos nucifera]